MKRNKITDNIKQQYKEELKGEKGKTKRKNNNTKMMDCTNKYNISPSVWARTQQPERRIWGY